jgi:hypothetical protein
MPILRPSALFVNEDRPPFPWGVEDRGEHLHDDARCPHGKRRATASRDGSPQAVARVLHEAGYQAEETPTHPHPDRQLPSAGCGGPLF